MTRLQNLNVYLTERLMAAAKEILEVVGDTISEYQKETARTMKENDELRRRLREIGLQANIVLLDSGHPVAPPVSIAGAHQRQLSPEDEWKPNLKKDTEPLPTAINQELSEQHNSRQEPAVRLDQQASVLTSVKSPSDHEFFQPSLPFEVQVVDTVEEGSSPDILPEQIKSEPDGLDYHTQEQPIDSQSLTRVNNDSNTPESKSCAAVNWMESGGVMSEPTTQESSREPSAGTYLTSSGKYKIRCSRSPPPPGLPPRKRSAVPAAVRKDGIDHFPTWQQTRQRCKYCVGNHFSHVYCGKCKVNLCLNKDRNCFLEYHCMK